MSYLVGQLHDLYFLMWENSSLAKTLISILNALFGDYFTATGNSTDMKLALFKKKKEDAELHKQAFTFST